MKKFDLSVIMRKAWKLYRKGVAAFSECLHRAWNQCKGRADQRPAHRGSPASRRCGRACEHMGRLESRRVHGRAWRKSSVSGGAYPQQQGGRPDLPGIVLCCFSGKALTHGIKKAASASKTLAAFIIPLFHPGSGSSQQVLRPWPAPSAPVLHT